jgi:hypothetical protein
VAEADEDLDEVLVDETEVDVLLTGVVPIGAQVAPKVEASLKESDRVPLVTSYLAPVTVPTVELPL